MDQRSVLTSLFGAIGNLPQGHDKPIKLAIYNAVALFLVFLCCATSWGLYMVLQPFIKPLMWALLVGSALHPLKRSLRDRFQNWFKMLEDTNTPTILGLMLLPVNIFNELSECIGKFLWDRRKLIVTILIIIPVVILLYQFTPRLTIQFLWILLNFVHQSLSCLINITSINLMIFILAGYLPLLLLYWDKSNNKYFHYGCIIMWFLLSCCAARQFNDQFKFPVFFLLEFIFLGGFLNELYENYSNMLLNEQEISFTNLLVETFQCKEIKKKIINTTVGSESKERDETLKSKENSNAEIPDPWSLELFQHDSSINKEKTINKPKFSRSISQPQFNLKSPNKNLLGRQNSILNLTGCTVQNYESTFYLYSVMWCCLIMLIWKNLILLPLLPLPIFSYCIKHVGHYLGFWRYLEQKFNWLFGAVQEWCQERHGALIPVPVKGIYRIIQKLNVKTKQTIKNSIDTVASCVVILGLIVFLISASIFTAIQIYAEGIMLVQMTSNVINQTVVQNPELRQLLPPTWDETMNSILDNAYQYGREGISKAVKSIMNDSDSVQSEKLETQILELWDRIYQSWMTSNETNGPKVTEDAVKNSWDDFLEDLKKSSELFNINGIVEFAKQNVGTLISLLESIWGLIISNLSLVLGSFSTCFQLILGGGTAVLNFILNMIVFLTTLFYLLNSSGNYYKPVELMTQFSPSGKRFGQALEAAINSVFSSSLKMAIFYGMWTWLIHNLFNVKIVYLSSAFATILGAVPFLGTYWACVPGILDLWLSQDRWIAASLFAGFQFLPTSFVDTAIYSEIKGGHPYLTGLAIAGGIFCLGVEGALIGPLLLCALYVAIDLLSSNLFKDSPA